MKNLFKKIIVAVLLITVTLTFIGCKDGEGNEERVTGKYEYKLLTGTRQKEGGEAGETETYKYYAITGYQVSDDDAEAIAENDYSNIDAKYRQITIPQTAEELGAENKDYPVEEISAGAFSGLKILTSVTVGSNIKKIGSGAFTNCVNLTSITLPFTGKSEDAKNSEKHFGFIFGSASTDYGNTQITAKPNANKDVFGNDLLTADDVTFTVPTSLTNVTVNSTSINDCAFYGVTTVSNVLLPNATEIGSHAFYGCTSLRKIDLSNVKSVRQYAFAECNGLYDVKFGEEPVLESIEHGAFYNCVKLNDSMFGDKAFIFPSTLNYLGNNAFYGCSKLTVVEVKALITVIPEGCFANCTGLTKFIVNSDNVEFKMKAFADCISLNKNVVKAGNPETEISLGGEIFGEIEF